MIFLDIGFCTSDDTVEDEFEPFGDQSLARRLHDAGADGQSPGLGIGVAHAVAIATEVAQHLCDSLVARILRAQIEQRPNDAVDPIRLMAQQMAILLELRRGLRATACPAIPISIDEHVGQVYIVAGERLLGDRTLGLGEQRVEFAFEVFESARVRRFVLLQQGGDALREVFEGSPGIAGCRFVDFEGSRSAIRTSSAGRSVRGGSRGVLLQQGSVVGVLRARSRHHVCRL